MGHTLLQVFFLIMLQFFRNLRQRDSTLALDIGRNIADGGEARSSQLATIALFFLRNTLCSLVEVLHGMLYNVSAIAWFKQRRRIRRGGLGVSGCSHGDYRKRACNAFQWLTADLAMFR